MGMSHPFPAQVDRSGVDGAAALVNAAFSGDDVGDGGSARVGSSPGDYGDYYSWHAAHSRRAVDLGEDRVLHVHYERLQDEPEAVARDIYAFLYPTESSPSRAKVDEAVHFASFAVTAARGDDALRKGVTGDHKIYLSKEHWDALAVKCAKRLALEDRCAYQVARLTQDCPAALRAVPGPRLDAHSSLSRVQVSPAQPEMHRHLQLATPSMNAAVVSSEHGLEAQSSMLFSQSCPSKPGEQKQR